MAIHVFSEEDALVVKPEGRINANNADEFSETLTDACRKSAYVKLDLNGVEYFSSAGLRGLIMANKVAELKGGMLEITGVGEELLKILADTGLDQSLTLILKEGTVAEPLEEAEEDLDLFGNDRKDELSPAFVRALPETGNTDQLLIAAVYKKIGVWVSLHEKDDNGDWRMPFTAVGFIGREGLFYSSSSRAAAGWTCAGSFPCDLSSAFEPLNDRTPFTEGPVAIPADRLVQLRNLVKPGCILVVDTIEKLGGSF